MKAMPDHIIADLLQIARHHREHERYYATEGLEQAAALRRDAGALRALAERWLAGKATDGTDARYDDPQLQAAGCDDLNDPAAVATAGILFMEGEGEPSEIARVKAKLATHRDRCLRTGRWLDEKMQAAWQREAALVTAEYADAAYARHKALMRTTLTASKLVVAGRLIGAAHAALAPRDHTPAQLRADPQGEGRLLRAAAWLMDAAASLIAEQAAELGASDPDWTTYIEDLAGGSKPTPA
jgi:hypothetical protein